MFAVFGLGNPGRRYARTRHNVGVWVVEEFFRSLDPSAPDVKWAERFYSRFVRVKVQGIPGYLVFPQTYMNESGRAVQAFSAFYKIEPEDVIVVHDDLDLEPGMIRIRQGGSSGGHRGAADIIRCLGTEEFQRIRIGIGHPLRSGESDEGTAQSEELVRSWVLRRPGKEQQDLLDQAVRDASQALRLLLTEGLIATQQRFNRKQGGG